MKRRISLATSVMSSLSRIWRDKILQLSTKIRLYQALVMSVFYCYMRQKPGHYSRVGGISHEVPTPDLAHTLVSACHKHRNIRSYRLTTCDGLHLKTSFVSIRPPIRLTQGTPVQHTMPYIVKLA